MAAAIWTNFENSPYGGSHGEAQLFGSGGQNKLAVGTLVGPTNYLTGGFALPATLLRLFATVSQVFFTDLNGNRVWSWSAATQKVLIYTALGTEAGNATDQSVVSASTLVVGKSLS